MDEAKSAPESETPYRVAFDNSHEAIVIAQDGLLKVANAAARRMTGYSLEEMVALPFLDIVHPEDLEQTIDRYQRRLEGDDSERSMVLRIRRTDGSWFWAEAHSMPVDWGGRPAVLVFLADVSDREEARREAAEKSRLVERIAELAPYFLFIYDYELGRDVYINRSVPLALGYSEAEAAALGDYPFLALCHPDDLARSLARDERWRGVANGVADVVEFRIRHRNGEWRWFRSHNLPFQRDADGRVTRILGMSEDVTEKKRSEQLLRQNERLESLGLLAGGVAHDFANLLTPIVGHVELLLARLPEDSPLRERARAIETAAARATELVDQLLVYAGRGEIVRRLVDLNALVEEAVRLLDRRGETPAIELSLEPGLPAVSGDASQLRQVVMNLLANARDALAGRPGGIRLATRRVELGPGELGGLVLAEELRPGPATLLEIADDGIGMDAETLARLWEPFFTTKPNGRGLGLPSALGILRQHGAGLCAESTPAVGSRFRIYLPPPPEPPAAR